MKEITYRKIVTAIFLIGIGKILLFHNLNLLPIALPEYVFSWKALLFLIGAYVLIAYRSLAGILLMLSGTYFIIPDVPELASVNLQSWWPIILIFLGLAIFVKSIFKPTPKNTNIMKIDKTSDSYFESSVIFGGEQKKLASYDFKGAKITTMFGGLELDLTDCYLSKEGPHIIDLNVICGGVEMKVSREWNIRSEIKHIMSGIEDHAVNSPGTYVDPAAEVILTGKLIMGGIEIKRV